MKQNIEINENDLIVAYKQSLIEDEKLGIKPEDNLHYFKYHDFAIFFNKEENSIRVNQQLSPDFILHVYNTNKNNYLNKGYTEVENDTSKLSKFDYSNCEKIFNIFYSYLYL